MCFHRPTSPSSSWRSLVYGGGTATLSGSERSWRGRARWAIEVNSTQRLLSTWLIKSAHNIDHICKVSVQERKLLKRSFEHFQFDKEHFPQHGLCSLLMKTINLIIMILPVILSTKILINKLFNACLTAAVWFSCGCSFISGGRPTSPGKSSFPAASVSRGRRDIWWLLHRGAETGSGAISQQVSPSPSSSVLPLLCHEVKTIYSLQFFLCRRSRLQRLPLARYYFNSLEQWNTLCNK